MEVTVLSFQTVVCNFMSNVLFLSITFHTDYFILSVTSHISCIVARCLINVVYLKVGHDDVALFE